MECRSNSSGHNFPVARLLIAALLLRHQPAHKVISVATYSADLEPGKQTLGCIGNFRLPREALFASRQSSSTSSTIRTSEIQTNSSPALYLAARRKHREQPGIRWRKRGVQPSLSDWRAAFHPVCAEASVLKKGPQKSNTTVGRSPKRVTKTSLTLGCIASGRSHYTQTVQRLFSMFPQGGPGFALLLLRISVAAMLLMSWVSRFGVSSAPLIFAGILLVSISLSIGFLTPFLSVIAGAAALANLLIGPRSGDMICIFTILDATALTLLGPGAYSVDARLFGLRVSIVHPRKKNRT